MSGVIRVTVVGGGLAGKAFTNRLINRIQQSSLKATSVEIHLLPGHSSHGSDSASEQHLYTGLWTKGAQIFQQIVQPDITPDKFLSLYAFSVGESGYRAADGEWIMKPYHGMASYPNKPSLTFMRNKDLNVLLDSSLERQRQSLSVVSSTQPPISFTHHHDTAMAQIGYEGQVLTIRDEQGRSYPTDILIAADGLHSRVRQQLLPQLLPSKGSKTVRPVEYRGYRVYRGVLELCHGPMQAQLIDGLRRQAFQTWAPNRRFAVVPTAHGIAWFAAVAQPLATTSHVVPAGITRSIQDDSAAYALLMDQFCRPDATTTALHDPIARIIQATDQQLIRYNDAYASPEVHKMLLGIHTLSSAHTAATAGSTVPPPRPTATQQPPPQMQPVVCAFLGDAAHTLDPILAQGAGIALEDADHVAQVMAHHVAQQDQERLRGQTTSPTASSSSSSSSSSVTTTLRDISDELAAQRYRRLLRLHTLSQIAQYLGQHPSPAFHNLLNGALLTLQRVLPTSVAASIVGRSFDTMIRIADRSETFSIAR